MGESLVIRRICANDCCQTFRTGENKFDFDAKDKPIELSSYLTREASIEEPFLSYVYEVDGEVIGILCIRVVSPALYLSRIGIKKGHRTKGNGYYLHKFMMDLVEEKKIKVNFAKAHSGVFRWFHDLGYTLNCTNMMMPHGERLLI
ncbi:MAG: GNAT family N-acetyltransferase [Chlamydiota bacterium]